MIGKVPPEILADVLDRTGQVDKQVHQPAAIGEDAAAIDIGEQTLVVSVDPISMATTHVGRLAIHVACNDIAASGAAPRWVTNTMFLPDDDPETIKQITTQLHETALDLGVSIVGGHSEYNPDLSRPLLSLCAIGTTDRFVGTGGANPGDVVLLVGEAALEGTAILANDFTDQLRDAGIESQTIDRAASLIDEISVIDAAMACRDDASAMHDPTEGGVVTGLLELAVASGVTVRAERERIPIRPETHRVCQAMDVDPLKIFGSGALLCTLSGDVVSNVQSILDDHDLDSAVIGTVDQGPGSVLLDGERIEDAPRDELYALWA